MQEILHKGNCTPAGLLIKDPKNYLSALDLSLKEGISVAFTALFVKVYHVGVDLQWNWGNITEWVVLVVMLVLFSCAYRKQTKYIVSRIDYHTEP